jgi:hypothetical protein
MGNFLRNARLFAAAAISAALVVATAPAVAADETAGSTGVSTRAPTSLSRHHGPTHVAASRSVRHIRPVQSNLDCTGAWCGRQFVLIVGIGF